MTRPKLPLRTLLSIGGAAGLFLVGGTLLWAASLKIPDLRSFEQRKVEQSTKIFDRTGSVLLYDVHENIQRTIVPIDRVSRHAKNATVAIEDAEFYEHHGVKPTAILRAMIANLTSLGFSQGGSTITQQVVKNSILTTDKTIARKLKEWVLALKLEQALSKEEILALYLNETPYGGSRYGIEEASRAFFGKASADLTLAEAAYLAALPQAPTYYSPYGSHRDKLDERKNLVLAKMHEHGFITEAEYAAARSAAVTFAPPAETSIKAPHFVFFIREYLEEKYGRRAVEERGFRVITTLDYEPEKRAEAIVETFARANEENFNAENAGLVAINPKTGQILAMVGSRNYFDKEIDGNVNVALARRQPGSAFKPFVYATAFAKGYAPETVVFDLPTQFSTTCAPDNTTSDDGCYAPGNYDNVFRGPVSFRNALAQSINVPAVKALYLAGISNSLTTARTMGITTLEGPDRYGLTLVLGGGEVTLLEMTSAYGVFANDGVRNPVTGILRIEDADGNPIEEFRAAPYEALAPQVARTVTNVLADNEARTPAFGERSYLYFPGKDVAAKTGTTNDYRDAWIIGYTPTIAVGAWAGNNDNSPMEKKVAGFIVAPLWHAFVSEALPLIPEERFKKPEPTDAPGAKPIMRGLWQGGVPYTIDTISKKLATDLTPHETREERVITDVHSILYWVDRENPLGPPPENPEHDPQFRFWEHAVEQWKRDHGFTAPGGNQPPTGYDDVHTSANAPRVTITSPLDSGTLDAKRMTVSATASGRFAPVTAEFYLDGSFVGSSKRAPFSLSFVPQEFTSETGPHTIRVVVTDSVFNRGEATQTIVFE